MQRFQKRTRILRAVDFRRVKRLGKTIRSGPIIVSAVQGEERRLGITVPRKTGNAVERNRIKRVVREFFRLTKDAFPRGDCVVIALTGSAELNNDDIRERLRDALERMEKTTQ